MLIFACFVMLICFAWASVSDKWHVCVNEGRTYLKKYMHVYFLNRGTEQADFFGINNCQKACQKQSYAHSNPGQIFCNLFENIYVLTDK